MNTKSNKENVRKCEKVSESENEKCRVPTKRSHWLRATPKSTKYFNNFSLLTCFQDTLHQFSRLTGHLPQVVCIMRPKDHKE